MRASLGVLCLLLLLLLLPTKGEPHSPSLPDELGAEGSKRGNATSQGAARAGSVGRARRATRLLSKPEPGAKCLQGMAELGWPLGGLEGPVCRVRMEQDGLSPGHLDVVGVLTHYESGFIRALRRRRGWDGHSLRTFGLCPAGQAAAPHPLQRIHEHLLEPGPERLLVLHLEEARLEGVSLCLECPPPAFWVFSHTHQRSVFCSSFPTQWPQNPRATGEEISTGILPTRIWQRREGQPLLSAGRICPLPPPWGQGQGFALSLLPVGSCPRGSGAPLAATEIQQLLFGSDDKCFTRMTPVLLLLAKARREEEEEEEEEEEALAPSSFLSADGVLDTAPYPQLSPTQAGPEQPLIPTVPSRANTSASPVPGSSSEFLGILTRFIRQVLSSSSEPPAQPSAHHWLDFQAMETLPHQLLNLSEEAALERLVRSEEPSVLLFPQDSGAVLEQQLSRWQPEGTVLRLLTAKLQGLIHELGDSPAFQANTALFQRLLSFCYYPRGGEEGEAAEGAAGSRKLHTLLLLKALQSVRARWQERRKVQRQHRSARPQPHCRLQELTIDLRDRKFIVMPTVYAANNCEGPCRLPLSTRVPSYYSHTVLLLGMQERGSPLQRAPCCVPVRYSDQLIISLSADGLEVRKFPNMVAEECGCR
ncbi:MIS factor, partial [Furnarius figulus]|nr:MIS factor [Furnarius figulus]